MRRIFDTITTERLVLRRFQVSDTAAVASAVADREVARWLPLLPYPYGLKDAEEFVAFQMGDAADAVAVEHNGAFVGCITTEIELGYWFARGFWSNGYATEAARAVVARHFSKSDTNLESGHLQGNQRSRKVLLKLGFTDTDLRIRRSNTLDKDVTIQHMELTSLGWRANT